MLEIWQSRTLLGGTGKLEQKPWSQVGTSQLKAQQTHRRKCGTDINCFEPVPPGVVLVMVYPRNEALQTFCTVILKDILDLNYGLFANRVIAMLQDTHLIPVIQLYGLCLHTKKLKQGMHLQRFQVTALIICATT